MAVFTSAERKDHFAAEVFRIPIANGTAIDGLFGLEGCGSLKAPQPGSPFLLPPAQTPPSKSAIIHGPLPAPLPQNALPKNSVFMKPYFVGSVVTLPKS